MSELGVAAQPVNGVDASGDSVFVKELQKYVRSSLGFDGAFALIAK